MSLTNSAATLTVTGISETGGNITVGNAGNLTTSGTVLDNTTGQAISLTATGGTLTVDQKVTGGGSGNVTLTATGAIGSLAVNNTVSGGNVTLSAAAGISEAGTITTGTLSATNSTLGDIVLGTATNNVATFAAQDAAVSSGYITFNDAASLTVGTVGSVVGVTTDLSDIILVTAGSLTINQTIDAGTGTVFLQGAGNVTQDTTHAAIGSITAGSLGVYDTTGKIDLENTRNAVGTFAAQDAATGQLITFVDNVPALAIGTATTTGYTVITPAITSVSGLQANNGDISVNTAGALAISQSIVDTGAVPATTVQLQAAGDVTQATAGMSGKIVASALGIHTTVGNIDLENVNNSVSTLAAVDTAANQAILFRDAITTPLTIGTVTSNSQFATAKGVQGTPDAVGLQANNGDITVNTAGALTINQSIVDTGPLPATTVRLFAAGDVTQATLSVAGSITASKLEVVTTGGKIDLENGNITNNVPVTFGNNVGTLASSANGPTTFWNFHNLTVGAVGPISGVTTTNGDIDLKTTNTAAGSGLLTIAAPIVSNGVGHIVTIDVPNGLANLANTLNPTVPTLVDATVSGAIPFNVNAASEIDIPNTITTHSINGTSITSGPGPLLVNLTVTAVESVTINDQGQATLTMQVGRPNESGYFATIYWNPQDKSDVTNQFIAASNGTSQFTISYTYTANELQQFGNNAFAVQIVLSHPQTQFLVNGSPVPIGTGSQISNETMITFQLAAPAGRLPPLDLQNILGIPIEVVPQQATLAAPHTLVSPPSTDQIPVFVPLSEAAGIGTSTSQLGVPFLKFLKPDGTFDKPDEISESRFLDLLSRRPAAYENLREGHYQVLLKPTKNSTVERAVLDVYVKQGQPIDFADFDEDAGDTQAAPEGQQPGAGGDQSRLDRTSHLEDRHTEAERETADGRGNLRTISQVPLVGAALVCEGLRRRWQRQAEVELQQAKNRPLTKAGRLYARLRRQAAQSLNSVSE